MFGRGQINLVENQSGFDLLLLNAFQDTHGIRINLCARHIMHQHDNITVTSALPRGANHSPIQPPFGLKNAGSINKNDLAFVFHGNAANTASGGLYLGRNNRYFLPDHCVH